MSTPALDPTQTSQISEMKTAMDRSAEFQRQMTLMNMEHSTKMSAQQTIKAAFDKIRA